MATLQVPIFVLAYALCVFVFSVHAEMKATGISLSSGLTANEKKALLDEHNRLRSLQAQGKVPGHPSAADMTRLEWSDKTAKHAQDWADRCPGLQHGNAKEFGDGQNIGLHSDRSALLKGSMNGWFHREYPMYTYGMKWPGSAGHYTQIVTAYSHKLGCGANKCPSSTFGQLVCNFFIGGNMYGKPPFQKGPACTKCPAGYGFCKDSLCTSSRVCSRSDSSCKCTVDASKCAARGTFDSASCQCRCNPGFSGLNCEEVCKDHPFKGCARRKRDGWCTPSQTNKYYIDTVLNCRASCGFCKAATAGSTNNNSVNPPTTSNTGNSNKVTEVKPKPEPQVSNKDNWGTGTNSENSDNFFNFDNFDNVDSNDNSASYSYY